MNDRLFVLSALNTNEECPGELQQSRPLYFSSLKQAQIAAACFRQAYSFIYECGANSKSLYCLVLEEYEMDSIFQLKLSTRVFSAEGEELDCSIASDDGQFTGRPEKLQRHKVGDIVEATCGEHLNLGIVLQRPLTEKEVARKVSGKVQDDCYTILSYPSLDVDYVQSPFVFTPKGQVDNDVCAYLHEAMDAYIVHSPKTSKPEKPGESGNSGEQGDSGMNKKRRGRPKSNKEKKK